MLLYWWAATQREGPQRRKIRLIEGNEKCLHLKKLTCRGTLWQVFICLRPRTPYPPHTVNVYTVYLFTQEKGRGPGRVEPKEVNKEQPSYRNLSATATRVLQCICPVAASGEYFSAIHTSPHLTSTHLTPDYANTIILHLVSVLYTAVNVWNKN